MKRLYRHTDMESNHPIAQHLDPPRQTTIYYRVGSRGETFARDGQPVSIEGHWWMPVSCDAADSLDVWQANPEVLTSPDDRWVKVTYQETSLTLSNLIR